MKFNIQNKKLLEIQKRNKECYDILINSNYINSLYMEYFIINIQKMRMKMRIYEI